jgi:hypothetical protein
MSERSEIPVRMRARISPRNFEVASILMLLPSLGHLYKFVIQDFRKIALFHIGVSLMLALLTANGQVRPDGYYSDSI